MILIQWFVIIFFVFVVSRTILRFLDKKITWSELVFWMVIWGGMLGIVFLPDLTELIATFLGVRRGMDLIIYASIAILFYLIFRLYVKIEETQKDITTLVRELSLKNGKNRKNSR